MTTWKHFETFWAQKGIGSTFDLFGFGKFQYEIVCFFGLFAKLMGKTGHFVCVCVL